MFETAGHDLTIGMFNQMLRAVTVILLLIVAALVAALLYGAYRWKIGTRKLRARLEAARIPIRPKVVDFCELDGLPAVVQRYFRTVLKEGQPMVAGLHVKHMGSFNMGETTDRWKPFTSDQKVTTQRPGFDWDARIALFPGVPVRVHDAFVASEGILHASLLGLFPVLDLRGTPDLAQGELMRFFAEAVWYPTALLPSQGVRWESANDHSAYGTLCEGTMTLTLLFTFDDEGLIDSVRAETRGRMVGTQVIPTPWQGHFRNYQKRGQIRVPLDGEVAWLLPQGPKPYWRGHITWIAFELAH